MLNLELVSKSRLEEIKSFAHFESPNLDFKEVFSLKDKMGLEIVKDIAAFANTQGGYIVFGVTKDYKWIGLDERSDEKIDDADLYNLCERYIDGNLELTLTCHELNGNEFVLLYISQSESIHPVKKNGQYSRKLRNGKQKSDEVFREGDVFTRRGSRSIRADHLFYRQKKANFSVINNLPTAPFHRFFGRSSQLDDLHKLLIHENTRLLQVDGIGGIGKTSLVYHYCTQLSSKQIEHDFDFIVWMSAKKTVYTPEGERKSKNFIASYQDVINGIVGFLGDPSKPLSGDEYATYANELLEQHNVLLVIDNMETLLEEELIDFLFNLPKSTKAILTTRELISNFQMSKVTLQGLGEAEFETFVEYEFRRLTNKPFASLYGEYTGEIYKYTKGMPLAVQLAINQLALNTPIKSLIDGLTTGKTYDSLLSFCFKGSLERLSDLERLVLYVLSMPTIEQLFTLEDLKYITGYSDDELSVAIQGLSRLSLCYIDKTSEGNIGYGTPHLTKLYVRKNDIKDKEKVLQKYVQFASERDEIADASVLDEQFLIRAHAKTHEQQVAALKVKNIMSVFYLHGYEAATELIDGVIDRCKQFGYLHYIKGMIEQTSNLYQSEKRASIQFSNATTFEPNLIDAWIAWAYLEQEHKRFERSKEYFKEALSINSDNRRANHGYAHALYQLARRNADKSLAVEAEIHYERGYYQGQSLSMSELHANAINAHSQALNWMVNLGDYNQSIKVCNLGLRFEPNNRHLLSLKGDVQKKLKESGNNNGEQHDTPSIEVKTKANPRPSSYSPKRHSKGGTRIADTLSPDVIKKLQQMGK